MKPIVGMAVAALSAVALVSGCSSSTTSTTSSTPSSSAPAMSSSITGDITVFAAASLKSRVAKLEAQLKASAAEGGGGKAAKK